MDLQRLVITQAALWALATARLGGFVITSPFPGENVSVTQRVGLVAVLAWVATGTAPTDHLPGTLTAALLAATLVEVAVGVVLGVTFRFVFSAAEILGQSLGQGTGLSSPSIYNPTSGTSDTALSRMVTLLAMLLALAMGAHRVAIAAVVASFHAIPLGTGIHLGDATGPLVDLAAQSLSVGIRLALPVTAVSLVVQFALAMIARAAPALQIFNVGLGITLATGIAVLLTVLPDMAMGLGNHLDTLQGWIGNALDAITAHDLGASLQGHP